MPRYSYGMNITATVADTQTIPECADELIFESAIEFDQRLAFMGAMVAAAIRRGIDPFTAIDVELLGDMSMDFEWATL